MQSPFLLSLVASWRLDGPHGQIPIAGRKARALLAALALTPDQVQTRAALATLLWGGHDDIRARASLRQAILELKTALSAAGAPLLEVTTEMVAITAGMLATDVDQTLEAIARGLPEGAEFDRIVRLPLILNDLADVSDGFAELAAQIVDRTVARAGQRLRTLYEDASHPVATRLRAARAAAALDGYDEAALRAQMQCLFESGSAASALRLYGAFFEQLQDELDAEPSAVTQELAVEIKLAEGRIAAPAPTEVPPLVTIAVLPFEFLGVSPVPPFVALCLLDQITCQLATYRAPAVISSNTTRRYLGKTPDPAELRTQIGAKYAVVGSVLHHGAEAAVAVQLVDTATGHIIWAGTYRCPSQDLFDIRASLAETIAGVVMPNVDVAEMRAAADRPADALEPYLLVLRAKDLIFRLDRGALDEAGALLEQAVVQAPRFAPAHALLGEWHLLRYWQGWGTPAETTRTAVQTHLSTAFALSPGDGRALALWAHCRLSLMLDHAGCLSMIETALNLQPNDAETLVWSTPGLAFSGHADRAVRNARTALALSPLDPFLFRNEHFLGIALYCRGDYDDASEQGMSCFGRAPGYGSNQRMTIAALMAAGRHAEAQPLVERHMAQEPGFTVGAFMPRQGLRDPKARRLFADRLITAGLPR